MTEPEVHWYEGQFLGPHHLQSFQRYAQYLGHVQATWGHPYAWGLASLKLDHELLEERQFVVHSVQARLKDGTLLDLARPKNPDEDQYGLSLDLRELLNEDGPVSVYLAVPLRRAFRHETARPYLRTDRYHTREVEQCDENSGDNPQPVSYRFPNARLIGTRQEELPGFSALKLAQVVRKDNRFGTAMLDSGYVPPLLDCSAWEPLWDNLRAVAARLRTKIDLLTEDLRARSVTPEAPTEETTWMLNFLGALNEAQPVFQAHSQLRGMHPVAAYIEWSRLVGRLALYGVDRAVPELPPYEHEGLGSCFSTLGIHLEGLLKRIGEPRYTRRPFIVSGRRWQVSVEGAWHEAPMDLYLAVSSGLKPAECARLLEPKELNMRLASGEQIDRMYASTESGVRWALVERPEGLPGKLVYFRIDTSPSGAWRDVRRHGTLGLRLNEHLIRARYDDREGVRVSTHDGREVDLRFALYALPVGGP
jgi:type VI secretion system protein ImpJ